MSKVAVVTDSTAYLPDDLVAAYNITVVPLVVIWGDETLLDNVDISPEEFYERLSKDKIMPSTSQPTVKAFAEVFEKLHHEGYEILTLVISAALPEASVECIDSKFTSVPLEFMVLSAARAAKQGASLETCKQIAETVRKHSEVFFAVDTLEFLHRGGRIGGASRFLGTALDLKPILQLEEGKIEALERVRTSKRAHNRLIELLETRIDSHVPVNMIGVVSAAAEEAASMIITQINKRFTPHEILMANLSPVIGTHTGPGTIGLAYVAGIDPEILKGA
jgi:DegV family protein with EDD domain